MAPPDAREPAALHSLYGQSLALLTDLYQLTMAYGYWKLGVGSREAGSMAGDSTRPGPARPDAARHERRRTSSCSAIALR